MESAWQTLTIFAKESIKVFAENNEIQTQFLPVVSPLNLVTVPPEMNFLALMPG